MGEDVRHSRIAIGICLLMLVGGLFGAVGVWAGYFVDSRLAAQGPRAAGTVIRKELVRSADGDSDHLVIYRFALPSGQEVTSQRGLPKDRWDALAPGAPLTVVYAADNPKRNFPEGAGITSLAAPLVVTLVFGGLAILGGAVLFTLLRRRDPVRTEA